MQEVIIKPALYLVATPIGNLAEISSRAKYILSAVDIVLCEDTRHSGKLIQSLGLKVKFMSFHLHNAAMKQQYVLDLLASGKSLALISDAGMPLISDPGHALVQACHNSSYRVIPISGSCALISAVAASGLCDNGFVFNGFVPPKAKARLDFLIKMSQQDLPWVCFEAPHRLLVFVADLAKIYPADHKVMLAKELTKLYENIKLTTVSELVEFVESSSVIKGELVIVVDKVVANKVELADEIVELINQMRLADCTDKSIANWLSVASGLPKNVLMKYLISSKNKALK